MKDIILNTDVQTSKQRYKKGIKYNIDDIEFNIIAMFSDIKEMKNNKLDTTGIQNIMDKFNGK